MNESVRWSPANITCGGLPEVGSVCDALAWARKSSPGKIFANREVKRETVGVTQYASAQALAEGMRPWSCTRFRHEVN
jgi:hypothetical protein